MDYENYIRRTDANQFFRNNSTYNQPETFKDYNVPPLSRQLSFDDVTTSNIYAAIQQLQEDVADIKRSIQETPELLKDLVVQMNEVLSALDDITAGESE
jgi:hypothetical protein